MTVFQPDAGVDTGPIVVQKRRRPDRATPTRAATLYFEKLYPLGVEAIREAVAAVAAGSARFVAAGRVAGASFQGLVDDAVARIDWTRRRARARPADPRLRPAARGARALRGERACACSTGACEPGAASGRRARRSGSSRAAWCSPRGAAARRRPRAASARAKKLAAAEAGLEAGLRLE